MLALSYNYNDDTESIAVIRNDTILDISIFKNTIYNSNIERFKRASKSFSNLINQYNKNNENILISFPPMLKGNKEKEIGLNNIDEKYTVNFSKNPLKINSAINYMINKNEVSHISYNNLHTPIKVYSDASIQENLKPTISFALLNNKNELLYLESRVLNGKKNISDYELTAGIAGLSFAKYKNFEDIIWISDNQDAQNVFDNSNCVGTKEQRDSLNNLRSEFRIFEFKDIRGKENRLADSLTRDIRKEFLPRYISYTSPALIKS